MKSVNLNKMGQLESTLTELTTFLVTLSKELFSLKVLTNYDVKYGIPYSYV
jgi:hypothetical protein